VLGSTNVFCHRRLLSSLRVGKGNRLCFDESVAYEVCDIFRMRAKMHRQLYQHRAVVVVESLLEELMEVTDSVLCLRDKARDPTSFLSLTDSFVLCQKYTEDDRFEGRPRDVFCSLFRRPWFYRVPLSVSLRTRPYCKLCLQPTRPTDTFCGSCGHETSDRPASSLSDGSLVTPECMIQREQVEEYLHSRTDISGIRVHIVDFTCGPCTRTPDSQGRMWREHHPLRQVPFFSHTGDIVHMSEQSFLVPETRHVRTVYCHLPVDTSSHTKKEAIEAFREWGSTVGHVTEERMGLQ
jgi:hypothetical protein